MLINKTPQNIQLKILAGYLLPASLHEDEMSGGSLPEPETSLCRPCPELTRGTTLLTDTAFQKDKKEQGHMKERGEEGNMVSIHAAV